GTISDEQYNNLQEKKQKIADLTKYLKENHIKITEDNKNIFIENNIPIPSSNLTYYELLKRPEIKLSFLENFIQLDYSEEVKEQVEIDVKYEGYIKKAYKEVEK